MTQILNDFQLIIQWKLVISFNLMHFVGKFLIILFGSKAFTFTLDKCKVNERWAGKRRI